MTDLLSLFYYMENTCNSICFELHCTEKDFVRNMDLAQAQKIVIRIIYGMC